MYLYLYLAVVVLFEYSTVFTVIQSVGLCPPSCIKSSLNSNPGYLGNLFQVNLKVLISIPVLGNPSSLKTA